MTMLNHKSVFNKSIYIVGTKMNSYCLIFKNKVYRYIVNLSNI